jgi:hypothetical protein
VSVRLTGACPYQHRPHRNDSVGAVGFEPTISGSRNRRNYQAFPRTEIQERPAGIEPAHPPWQGSRLPLHHGRLISSCFNCQRAKSTGSDSNRRRRITGAESLPLNDQCFVVCGTRGIRTLTSPVKSQVCSNNTSVPLEGCRIRDAGSREQGKTFVPPPSLPPQSFFHQLARKELNPRPASYKDAALTAELRASGLGRRDSNPHQPD